MSYTLTKEHLRAILNCAGIDTTGIYIDNKITGNTDLILRTLEIRKRQARKENLQNSIDTTKTQVFFATFAATFKVRLAPYETELRAIFPENAPNMSFDEYLEHFTIVDLLAFQNPENIQKYKTEQSRLSPEEIQFRPFEPAIREVVGMKYLHDTHAPRKLSDANSIKKIEALKLADLNNKTFCLNRTFKDCLDYLEDNELAEFENPENIKKRKDELTQKLKQWEEAVIEREKEIKHLQSQLQPFENALRTIIHMRTLNDYREKLNLPEINSLEKIEALKLTDLNNKKACFTDKPFFQDYLDTLSDTDLRELQHPENRKKRKDELALKLKQWEEDLNKKEKALYSKTSWADYLTLRATNTWNSFYQSSYINLADGAFTYFTREYLLKKEDAAKIKSLEKQIEKSEPSIAEDLKKEIEELAFPAQAAGALGGFLGVYLTFQLSPFAFVLSMASIYLGMYWQKMSLEKRINMENAKFTDAAFYDIEASTLMRLISLSMAIYQTYITKSIEPLIRAVSGTGASLAATKLFNYLKNITSEKITDGQLYSTILISLLSWELGQRTAGYAYNEYNCSSMVDWIIKGLEKAPYGPTTVKFKAPPSLYGRFWKNENTPVTFDVWNEETETSCTVRREYFTLVAECEPLPNIPRPTTTFEATPEPTPPSQPRRLTQD